MYPTIQPALQRLDTLLDALASKPLLRPESFQQWLLAHGRKLPETVMKQWLSKVVQRFAECGPVEELFPFWLHEALRDTITWADGQNTMTFKRIWQRALLHSEAEQNSLYYNQLMTESDACHVGDDCIRCRAVENFHTSKYRMLRDWSTEEPTSRSYSYNFDLYEVQEPVTKFRYSLEHERLQQFLLLTELLDHFACYPCEPMALLSWLFEHFEKMDRCEVADELRVELIEHLNVCKENYVKDKQRKLEQLGEVYLEALFDD